MGEGRNIVNEPTEKQENTVLYICRRLNIKPPQEYSRRSYWEFINKNLLNAQWGIKDNYDDYDDMAEQLFMDAGGYY